MIKNKEQLESQDLVRESLKVNITYLLTELENTVSELEAQNMYVDEEDEEIDFVENVKENLRDLSLRLFNISRESEEVLDIFKKVKKLLKLYSEGER